jgi:hypothetical protein
LAPLVRHRLGSGSGLQRTVTNTWPLEKLEKLEHRMFASWRFNCMCCRAIACVRRPAAMPSASPTAWRHQLRSPPDASPGAMSHDAMHEGTSGSPHGRQSRHADVAVLWSQHSAPSVGCGLRSPPRSSPPIPHEAFRDLVEVATSSPANERRERWPALRVPRAVICQGVARGRKKEGRQKT